MSLPVIRTPEYHLTIPSNGQQIVFRPFLVAEEKILLIALQSEDERHVIKAIEDIIKACIITPIDLSRLSMFDLEFIFIKIRSKSVGEVIDVTYRCPNMVEVKRRNEDTGVLEAVNEECRTNVTISIRLDEIQVEKDPEHSTQIKLTDTVGLIMRYPSLPLARKMEQDGNTEDVTKALDLIAACVESVFDGDSVTSEFNHDEMTEWLQTLMPQQFAAIQKFFDTIPRLRHNVHFECQKCGYEQDIVIQGIHNFFA